MMNPIYHNRSLLDLRNTTLSVYSPLDIGVTSSTDAERKSSIEPSPLVLPSESSALPLSLERPVAYPEGTATTPPSEERNDDGTIRVPSGSGYRIMTPFPWRLHEMLEEVEQKNLQGIVSWLPGGCAFQVHSQDRFVDTIIPMFFRHSRYKSFQRQLYLYGFRSLEIPSMSKGAYYHPLFNRDNRLLCRQIVRPKPSTTTSSSLTAASTKRRPCSNAKGKEKSSMQERRKATRDLARNEIPMEDPPSKVTSHSMNSMLARKGALLDVGFTPFSIDRIGTRVQDSKTILAPQCGITTGSRTTEIPSENKKLLPQRSSFPLLSGSSIVSPHPSLTCEEDVSLEDFASLLFSQPNDKAETCDTALRADCPRMYKRLEPFSDDIISLFGRNFL